MTHILGRKEEERVANGGLFFWGIGNAVGPSIRGLLGRTTCPEALFSPIRSSPRPRDVSPASVTVWTSAHTLMGSPFQLPTSSLITSRLDPSSPKFAHYALVCYSDRPLGASGCEEQLRFNDLRNLLTGRPVGASQVTAVVEHQRGTRHGGPTYSIDIRARLIPPYFLRLTQPVPISNTLEGRGWPETVRDVWRRRLAI